MVLVLELNVAQRDLVFPKPCAGNSMRVSADATTEVEEVVTLRKSPSGSDKLKKR